MLQAFGSKVDYDAAAKPNWKRSRRSVPSKGIISIGVVILAVTFLVGTIFRKRRKSIVRNPKRESKPSQNNRLDHVI